MENNVLTIVVPCYNEQEVLPETVKELGEVLEKLTKDGNVSPKSKILFVNDGSKDKTWELISKYTKEYEYVTGIKFSRNYGHQNALLAGMMAVKDECDAVITLDADLQHDIYAIPEFISKFEESEKEDLNITILKQKMDTLPIQKTVEITANIYS